MGRTAYQLKSPRRTEHDSVWSAFVWHDKAKKEALATDLQDLAKGDTVIADEKKALRDAAAHLDEYSSEAVLDISQSIVGPLLDDRLPIPRHGVNPK